MPILNVLFAKAAFVIAHVFVFVICLVFIKQIEDIRVLQSCIEG